MRLSRLVQPIAAILAFFALSHGASAQSAWDQPASDLAAQIASILGHGAARLMIRNLSSLPVDEIPAIRKLLEQDLRARGVVANSAPNETVIRVTLSESAQDYVWVAEVIRGDDTQVAVVDIPSWHPFPLMPQAEMILRRVPLYESKDTVLGAFEFDNNVVLLTPHAVKLEVLSDIGWMVEQHSIPIPAHLPAPRDPHGVLMPTSQEPALLEFEAWFPGEHCTGSLKNQSVLNVDCHASDDPWPLAGTAFERPSPSDPASTPISNAPAPPPPMPARPELRTFYNVARDYFTGVVSPSQGVDLPPFYSAAYVPWKTSNVLVIGTVDGKFLLADDGKIIPLNGTSDWGSDFATIRYGCGAGLPIVSGAGNSNTDTLRAYQITGSDARPASAPLAIDGTVTALWSAPDGKSVFAVIRNSQNEYEVDRVTAPCN